MCKHGPLWCPGWDEWHVGLSGPCSGCIRDVRKTMVKLQHEHEGIERLRKVARAAKEVLSVPGLMSGSITAATDQFTASWRNLREALEGVE